MKEGTNKAIIVNSIYLYIRLILTAVISLITTRFALQALGVENFGLFSVIGGVVSFVVVINTIMLSTSNRFIAIAIGKNDEEEINATFNINLSIHLLIAILTLIFAFPLGDWYINKYINYSGSLDTVVNIYNIAILGTIVSFIGIPYNGLLMAKERFSVFCITDIAVHFVKLIICYLMLYFFEDKLMVYTLANVVVVAAPVFVYVWYCYKNFPLYVSLRRIRNIEKYKKVLNFSVWVGYGAIASVGKSQGAALIINKFFSTALNASLGLTNSVNALLINFANNVSKSITPQIVKNYSSGNLSRSQSLVCLSSKMSFLLTILISSPFFLCPNYVFVLWLGQVPEKVVLFTQLMVIDNLVRSLNSGIPDLVFATGKIKVYQLIENSLLMLSVFCAYIVLRLGMSAEFLFVTYILFSIIVLIVRQVLLNRLIKFDNKRLLVVAYLPALIISVLFSLVLFIPLTLHPLVRFFIGFVYLIFLIIILGLNKAERQSIILKLSNKFKG